MFMLQNITKVNLYLKKYIFNREDRSKNGYI